MSSAEAATLPAPQRGWVRRHWIELLVVAILAALVGWLAVAVKRVQDAAARTSSQ